jgi:hypothetical protein
MRCRSVSAHFIAAAAATSRLSSSGPERDSSSSKGSKFRRAALFSARRARRPLVAQRSDAWRHRSSVSVQPAPKMGSSVTPAKKGANDRVPRKNGRRRGAILRSTAQSTETRYVGTTP